MGKYDKFGWHFANIEANQARYNFKDIAEILGFALPTSAKIHRSWWANDKTHVQAADSWLNHGWIVNSVDMKKQAVEFLKVESKKRNKKEKNPVFPDTPKEFENFVTKIMSKYYNKKLSYGQIANIRKLFDMVSEDKK